MGDKVTEAEKAPVKEAIEKLKTAQKGTDLAAIKAATEEVQKAFYAVSEKLYKNAAPQASRMPTRTPARPASRRAAMTTASSTRTTKRSRTTNS